MGTLDQEVSSQMRQSIPPEWLTDGLELPRPAVRAICSR